jgi:RNA polymerase sigma factor (TIGR02999 family)
VSADADEDLRTLIDAARAGDGAAQARLIPLVEATVRKIVHAQRGRATGRATLQTTAIVDEVLLRMLNRAASVESRAHFYRLAALVVRHVLVDHARRRKADRRGGSHRRVPLDDSLAWFEEQQLDLLALHEALERLERLDERKARIVLLRFFAGRSQPEVADVMGLSLATVEREWAAARAWLLAALAQ